MCGYGARAMQTNVDYNVEVTDLYTLDYTYSSHVIVPMLYSMRAADVL